MSDSQASGRIRDLEKRDCGYLAAMHLRYFGPSIVSVFGERFLKAVYEGMVGASWGRTIVYEEGGETLGFATLVLDARRFFLEIIRRKWPTLIAEVAKTVIARPSLARNVIKSALYPGAFRETTRAELLTLITREECRGRGIGSKLVDEVETIFREAGIGDYKVSVKKDWKRAMDFYAGKGFTVIGELDDGRKGLVFLRRDLSTDG